MGSDIAGACGQLALTKLAATDPKMAANLPPTDIEDIAGPTQRRPPKVQRRDGSPKATVKGRTVDDGDLAAKERMPHAVDGSSSPAHTPSAKKDQGMVTSQDPVPLSVQSWFIAAPTKFAWAGIIGGLSIAMLALTACTTGISGSRGGVPGARWSAWLRPHPPSSTRTWGWLWSR
uniref:Uncharacterized protein n=2 Tax=Rhizochromulina marina TaxID=1034831 RepID=A0A7S2WEN2_9STRA|mmetsp:Transcript_22450/g.65267  ORF Transcript_22450/g.65267 Transcript_22450/m.65267 type:complete len:175 (+) Transcript_22450:46-570(+)